MEEKYKSNLLLIERAQAGEEEATEELILLNEGLVRSLASRFVGRGTDFEDLHSLGRIGLLKAIRTFDTARGCTLSTYAVPLILGEIRRFLRDDGPLKVSRVQKRLGASLAAARELLSREGICDPPISLLAERVGVSVEEATEALDAAAPPRSFSDPVSGEDGITLESFLSDSEENERHFEKIALRAAIEKLPTLRKRILLLRYFKDLSQTQTARILGLSQVKVSREEKKILLFLKEELS